VVRSKITHGTSQFSMGIKHIGQFSKILIKPRNVMYGQFHI